MEVELIAGDMPTPPPAQISQLPETPQGEVAAMTLPEISLDPDDAPPVEAIAQPLSPKERKPSHMAARSTSSHESNGASAPSRAGSAAVQPATQVYTTQPPYPAGARESGVQGTVRLRVRVGADSCLRDVAVAHSSGRSDFDNAALGTVKREWRFRAARAAAGYPVESTVLVTIRFELNS